MAKRLIKKHNDISGHSGSQKLRIRLLVGTLKSMMNSRPWLIASMVLFCCATVGAVFNIDGGVMNYTIPFAGLICAAAALILPNTVWRWTGFGLIGWIIGDMFFFSKLNTSFQVPSFSDFGYVMLYIGLYISLYKWTKSRYQAFTWRLALDGALVGATVGALVAAFAFPKLIEGAQTASLTASFSLVYPVADMMLLMFVILVLGRRGWHPERVLLLLGCALVCFTITDVSIAIINLQDAVNDSYAVPSSALDLGRMLGAVLLACAASGPSSDLVYKTPSRWAVMSIPSICAVVSVILLALVKIITIPLSSWALATLTLILVVGRLVTAYVERDEAYEERARQERLLRDLLADMSHELRTPLTNVKGQLEQMYAEGSGDSTKRLGSALRSTQRMETLIGELLLLARAKSRNLSIGSKVNLTTIVKEAIDETELSGIGHPMEKELPDAYIAGDRLALVRVVINLLSNAYRHTPPGTTVTVKTWTSAGHTYLRVADAGAGINEELKATMWDRYVKGEHPDSSGIGLALVRAIVVAHEGNIELEDRDGTSFLLSFPTWREPDKDTANTSKSVKNLV